MGKKSKKKSSAAKLDNNKRAGFSPQQTDFLTSLTWQLGDPMCTAEGMELVHVECRQEPQGRVLRLYIDKPGGVTLSDCENISRQIGDLIDVHTDDQVAYLLEVSSPGSNRPLGKPSDFNRFEGQKARIRTMAPINEQRSFKGILAGFDNDIVTIQMENDAITIPLAQIKDARLIEYQGEI